MRAAFTFPQDTISTARWALHWLLLVLTLCTTTLVGVVLTQTFQEDRPLELEQYLHVFTTLHYRPQLLIDGLAFSLTLMIILLAHELGHYFACRYYGIDASLPYFIPFPFSPIGTFGAFIRIRSPIYTRQALFDVGIAGPLAGFVVLLPFLVIGIGASKVIPGIAERGDLIFGVPAIQRFFEWIIFPHVRVRRHPAAPHRARRLGRNPGHRAQPAADGPIGWRAYPLCLYWAMAQPLSRIFIVALVADGIFYSH